MEHKESPRDQAAERSKVIPMQLIAEVKRREDAKDRQGDDLLNHLQLVRRKRLRADPVSWHLQAVFEESNAPTDKNHLPQRHLAKLQVPVPRKSHKNVRADEQQNSPHE